MEEYNYTRLDPSSYDFSKFSGPKAGETMVDVPVYNTDGSQVNLSDFLGQWAVLETGSQTCPMYARNVSKMAALAAKYKEVAFLVLYVREAHPGKKIGAHDRVNIKIERARQLKELYGENRQIIVDDLQGTAHLAYGGFPNMVYVIDPEGKIVYRCDWSVIQEVDKVLAERDRVYRNDHINPPDKPSLISMLSFFWKRCGVDTAWDFLVSLLDRKLWCHFDPFQERCQ